MNQRTDISNHILTNSITQDTGINMKLFTHLIIMGIDTTKEELTYEKIFNNTMNPYILEIYPKIDKLPRYLENYKLWCFPEGLKIYDERVKVLEKKNLEENEGKEKNNEKNNNKFDSDDNGDDIDNKDQLYNFIMTDELRVKRYCSALLFHERNFMRNDQKYNNKERPSTIMPKVSIRNFLKNPLKMNDNHDMVYVPKSISIISNIPIFKAQTKILEYLYHNIIKRKRHKENERIIKIPETLFFEFDMLYLKTKPKKNNEYKIDEEWDKLYNIKDKISLYKNNKGIIIKCIEIKETQLFEFYISVFFSLMPIKSKSREIILLKPYYDNEEEELLRYRINNINGINIPGYNFNILFKKLSLLNIIRIIKFIMLERKIIIFSKKPEDIPNVTETLISLIAPMQADLVFNAFYQKRIYQNWMCVYIPYLPISMVDVLDSFMPYIIGMSKKYMNFVLENYETDETVIIDLDEDKIIAQENIFLPKIAKDYILEKMDMLLKKVNDAPHNKVQDMWINFILKARQVFQTFLLQIINNYILFFKFDKKEEGLDLPGLEIFKSDEYLKLFPKEDLPFMEAFCRQTMMFSSFLEGSYHSLYNCDIKQIENWDNQSDDISHFIKMIKSLVRYQSSCTTTINNNNNTNNNIKPDYKDYLNIVCNIDQIKIVESMQFHQLNETLNRYENPEKIDLMKYLIKYYYKFFHLNDIQYRNNQHKSMNNEAKNPFQLIRDLSVISINKACQLLPKLAVDKIVDLNKVFQLKKKEDNINQGYVRIIRDLKQLEGRHMILMNQLYTIMLNNQQIKANTKNLFCFCFGIDKSREITCNNHKLLYFLQNHFPYQKK